MSDANLSADGLVVRVAGRTQNSTFSYLFGEGLELLSCLMGS
jgi:hypothetical protein